MKEQIDGVYADLDFTRIYGSGQSAGSMATQGFAFTNPEFYAAAGSTSGIIRPEEDDALPQAARDVTVVRWLWQMTAVSVAAQLGAAPLVAYYFGRVSCYFLLSNFVVIPASTVILYGVVLVVALNWWAWLQALLVKLLVGVVSFMNAGVTFIASLPGSSIEGVSINLVQLAMVYVMIFTVYVLSFYLRKMRWNRV